MITFTVKVTRNDPPQGDDTYGKSTDIYEQKVDKVDLVKIIKAVNGLGE